MVWIINILLPDFDRKYGFFSTVRILTIGNSEKVLVKLTYIDIKIHFPLKLAVSLFQQNLSQQLFTEGRLCKDHWTSVTTRKRVFSNTHLGNFRGSFFPFKFQLIFRSNTNNSPPIRQTFRPSAQASQQHFKTFTDHILVFSCGPRIWRCFSSRKILKNQDIFYVIRDFRNFRTLNLAPGLCIYSKFEQL